MASKYLGLELTINKSKETKNPTINLKIRLFFERFFFLRKELNNGKENKK